MPNIPETPKKGSKLYNMKLFWEHNKPWQRLQYLRDWEIFLKVHPETPRMDYEDMIPEHREIIAEAHHKAVHEEDF